MSGNALRDRGPTGTLPWIAFDFLNSLIIANGTVHFSTWLTGPAGVDPQWYGIAYVVSGVLLLLGLPILGSLVDRKRLGRPVLLAASLGVVACSVGFVGVGHWDDGALRDVLALALFVSMNVVYHASLVAYNWLLVYVRGVRSVDDVRRTSGYGEAAGMAGSVVGVALGIALIAALTHLGSREPRIDMFLVLGPLFLVTAGVDYAFLRRGLDESRAPVVRTQHHRVWPSWIALLRRRPSLRRFFVVFLLANSLLTVQLYLPIYLQKVFGYGPQRTGAVFMGGVIAATCGGLLYAKVGARHDTRRVILAILAATGPTVLALAWARNDLAFLGALVLTGTLYGALWGACRAHLIELTPRANLGRALAFFAVFERSASIFGPLVWAGILLLPLPEDVRFSGAISAMGAMVFGAALLMWHDVRATGASRSSPSLATSYRER